MSALEDIQRQVMWNRLIAVVEEQAQTMIRTAFSTTVREAGDLSAGIFDLQGRMLAQAVTGTPGHVNSMMESVGHFLRKFPAETLQPGDHLITNDPWLGTGHLHDLTVVTPAFHRGRLVALFANTAHVIDVGGLGMGPEGRSVFEEGLYIPIVKCFEAGRPNATFFDFLRAGTRQPVELEGDVYSLCACNEAGARRLVGMLDEFRLDGIDALATHIFESSRRATLAQIALLPPGRFTAEIWSDGYEAPIRLSAAMTIAADGITVNFEGTSGLSGRGINVPAAYARAYACFGIKCVVAPEIPNNTASLAPFRMLIPEGTILNAPRPSAVAVRHVVGQLLPDLMMGCLHQAVPDRGDGRGIVVFVESAASGWRDCVGTGFAVAELRGDHVQLGWHWRTTRAGWIGWNGVSVGRADDAGGGDGERRARGVLAQGVAAGQRGRRADPGRVRADHGDRGERRCGVRMQCDLRSSRSCATRTRGRAGRRAGRGSTARRGHFAHQGLPDHSRGRSVDPGIARRRRTRPRVGTGCRPCCRRSTRRFGHTVLEIHQLSSVKRLEEHCRSISGWR